MFEILFCVNSNLNSYCQMIFEYEATFLNELSYLFESILLKLLQVVKFIRNLTRVHNVDFVNSFSRSYQNFNL